MMNSIQRFAKTRTLIGVLLMLTFAAAIADAERVNQQFTITAGTPVRIASQRQFVNRLFIQTRTGSTGTVYVMLGVPVSATCSTSNAKHVTAELAPGTATLPGGSFSDPQGATGMTPADGEDMALACLDGTHTGDVVIVSFWKRN